MMKSLTASKGNTLVLPLFVDKEFEDMFRISRSRMQRLIEDIGNSGNNFLVSAPDAVDRDTASMGARILLPLKTIAYGFPPH